MDTDWQWLVYGELLPVNGSCSSGIPNAKRNILFLSNRIITKTTSSASVKKDYRIVEIMKICQSKSLRHQRSQAVFPISFASIRPVSVLRRLDTLVNQRLGGVYPMSAKAFNSSINES